AAEARGGGREGAAAGGAPPRAGGRPLREVPMERSGPAVPAGGPAAGGPPPGSPGGAPAEVVRVVGLHKSFRALDVLKGIDLEVRRGEVVCLIGPSGSGKSTLLRCLNFLEEPSA